MNTASIDKMLNTPVIAGFEIDDIAATLSFVYSIQRLMRSSKKFQLSIIAPMVAGYMGSTWLRNNSLIALGAIAFAFMSRPALRRYRRWRTWRSWRRK